MNNNNSDNPKKIKLENTKLELYKAKYYKIFLSMALDELQKYPTFVEWKRNKNLKNI